MTGYTDEDERNDNSGRTFAVSVAGGEGTGALQKLREIISDDEINSVHGSANFGTMTPREVVNDGVWKSAVGYHCGHTQFSILRDHGLITKPRGMSYDVNLTKKGKRYYRVLAGHPAGGETQYHAERIAEVMKEGDGFWKACSGCQEGVDGYVSTDLYPFSKIFNCQPGAGCSECGGLGVLWDDIDYDAMAASILTDMKAEDGALTRVMHLENAIRHARFQLNDGQGGCVFYNLGQALKENPLPAAAEVAADAERFRALMRCGRIKMQGSSGVDPHTLERNGNNVHFGAEFWPEPYDPAQWEATYGESTRWGRACLRALADAILEDEDARQKAAGRGLEAEA